tara:strand:- start:3752 stop:4939 length:1188 start_codon:yes stop_codon:yes gene_type:complete
MNNLLIKFLIIAWEILSLPLLLIVSFLARFYKKPIDVGLGPEPLINNFYHKRALELFGYTAETFVKKTYYIIKDFDFKFSTGSKIKDFILFRLLFIDFFFCLFRYKSLYIYFNGGPLLNSFFLWKFEPFLFKLAKLKIVVMPYGSDVQTLDQTPNLYLKECYAKDYPTHRFYASKIKLKRELWIKNADFIISGCDWVDYLHYWDKLMVSHFSIDTDYVLNFLHSQESLESRRKTNNFVILHAPNHKSLKGTEFIKKAIDELKAEGFLIDFYLVQGKSNSEILNLINHADLVIDQLVIGWYAMFAIEAMTLNKPVICYLREDLLSLYKASHLIAKNEPPLINSSPLEIKETIRKCITKEIDINFFAKRGFEYVERVHSIKAVGEIFNSINYNIGLK